MTVDALLLKNGPFSWSRRMFGVDGTRACEQTSGVPAVPAAGSWAALRPFARFYVVIVAGFGGLAIALSIPQLGDSTSGIFTALAVLSIITAFAKVSLPVRGGESTFTACYVVDFTTLLLLGTPYATLTTAAGVWTQATCRCRGRSRLHQTWFSVGALAITIQVAGFVFRALGGRTGSPRLFDHPAGLALAAGAYFAMNSILVATVVGLSSRQSVVHVWRSSYARMWPEYLFGCSLAALAAAGIARSPLCLIALAVGILVLTHRNLKAYAVGLSDSTTDALTGLANRRSLTSRAAQELARSERTGSPLALTVVDLDGFKSINDTYGHHAGDMALREAATRLQRSLRSYDMCGRYGGDEFLLILPGCGSDDAVQKASTLQHAIEEFECEIKPSIRVPLRASIGSAVFPGDGRTLEALFATADRNMYQDKRARRIAVTEPGRGEISFARISIATALD